MDEQLGLADSSYTASSADGGWVPENMQIAKGMAWVNDKASDLNPWIRVDMLNTYTVLAFHMLRTINFKIIFYNIKVSFGGNDYVYVGENIGTGYTTGVMGVTYWFDNPTNGRYWIIEPVTFSGQPYVKGDFIGYV